MGYAMARQSGSKVAGGSADPTDLFASAIGRGPSRADAPQSRREGTVRAFDPAAIASRRAPRDASPTGASRGTCAGRSAALSSNARSLCIGGGVAASGALWEGSQHDIGAVLATAPPQ